jgi:hypothetical protein
MEAGFAGVLNSNGANVLHQLEIATEHEGIPIKAHLDFTLVWGPPLHKFMTEFNSVMNIRTQIYLLGAKEAMPPSTKRAIAKVKIHYAHHCFIIKTGTQLAQNRPQQKRACDHTITNP